MKLSDNQIKAVEENTGLQPVPEDNPAMSQLKENFGEHTFYVDDRGLYVLETAPDDPQQDHATAVQVAQWTDENMSALQPHEPKATDAIIKITSDDGQADGDGTGGGEPQQ